jgi:NAD(P)-dependent dehydrogenase (short-subunit alcohol dehydrogenase family)
VSTIHLYNLFTPLILKGRAKKVIAITTGMADLDLVNNYAVDLGGPYSISKAALNMAVAKFNATYHDSGVLFMGVSPGFVSTSTSNDRKQTFTKMKEVEETHSIFLRRTVC